MIILFLNWLLDDQSKMPVLLEWEFENLIWLSANLDEKNKVKIMLPFEENSLYDIAIW